jgi:two-component system response regulator HydG
VSASILLADDEPGFRDLFAFAFEPLGHRITMVTDGAEAVAQAAMRPFDLVVLDLYMPRLSGLEALKQIKALVPATRVLLVSGDGDRPKIEAEARAAGAALCLFKPLELEVLLDAVQANLPGRA